MQPCCCMCSTLSFETDKCIGVNALEGRVLKRRGRQHQAEQPQAVARPQRHQQRLLLLPAPQHRVRPNEALQLRANIFRFNFQQFNSKALLMKLPYEIVSSCQQVAPVPSCE